jgi:alpha-tubulin suppressor-like RCC1 family protein
MPVFNFKDNDGIDIGNKYVTKEYVMDVYPDLVPGYASPDLYTWGRNLEGQLATGNTTARSSPGTTVGGGATWKQIAANIRDSSSFAQAGIKTDGTLWTWGQGAGGMLGDATTSIRSSPVTTAGGGTNWAQVAVGVNHMAGVKSDGTLWTWGRNSYGGLGDGGGASRSSPGTTAGGGTNWKQVSCGFIMTAAIKSDGTLWTWGYNGGEVTTTGNSFDTYGGALGAGSFAATGGRSSPGTTSGGGTNWKFVSVGATTSGSYSNSVGAIKTDGTLWTWGNNNNNTLGSGTGNRSSPGTTSGGDTTWKQVSVGIDTTAAIKTDGTLWVWGVGGSGRLGTGNTSTRTSPVTTAGGGTDWKQVSVGYSSMAAIKTDGTLWTWGNAQSGQLGTGDTTSRSSPGTTAGGGTDWKQISCAYFAMIGIREQGGW